MRTVPSVPADQEVMRGAAARADGYVIPVVAVIAAVVVLLLAVLYPAHRDAVARERLNELTKGVLSAAAELDKRRAVEGVFPAFYAPGGDKAGKAGLVHSSSPTEPLHHYIATNGNQAYSLTSEHAALRLWVGVNSSGVRCQCTDCAGPTIFNQTTTTCPSGTRSF